MAVVIASDLAKDMAGEPLFRGVSFRLGRRDRMTLSGRNGAGKTTLLRVLAGETSVDGGGLSMDKDVRVSLHDQRPPRDTEQLTLRDYVLSGCKELLAIEARLAELEQAMAGGAADPEIFDAYGVAQARLEHAGGYGWRESVIAMLHGLGFRDEHFERSLSTFSGGELTRASLARALAGAPDLLLLDEPTNHLDIESLEWLENYLQTVDAAVVLVAHDRWFLEAVGTSVLELEGGRGRFFKGTWHTWRREKAAREIALGRAIEKQQDEIARLERFVDRFSAGTRARQAQSRAKRLDKMDRVERDPRDGKGLGFAFKPPERSGRVVFELEDATLRIGDRSLLEGAELWLERGEHVSLVGPNGSGKTTLISALSGLREFDGGKRKIGHNVKLGLLSQHSDELDEQGSVAEATQRATGLPPNKARALLGQFMFSGEAADKPVSGLSGGERRRLTLAHLVHSGANVLILDEPTNHLDLESREALERALATYPGAVLLISHDRALLDAVGTRTVAVENRGLTSYEGGWAEYLRVREEAKAAKRVKPAAAAQPVAKGGRAGDKAIADGSKGKANGGRTRADGSKAKVKGDATQAGAGVNGANGSATTTSPAPSREQRKRARQLEADIAEAEGALVALEAELADPDAWADAERAKSASVRHREVKQAVEGLYSELELIAG